MYLLRVVFICQTQKIKINAELHCSRLTNHGSGRRRCKRHQAAGDKSRATKREHLEPEFKTAISWGQKTAASMLSLGRVH